MATDRRLKGRVTTWNDAKGFGFITPLAGGKQVFVHVKAFTHRQRRPSGNEIVTYQVTVDPQGRPQAGTVVFAGEAAHRRRRRSPTAQALISASVFLLFVAGLTSAHKIPLIVMVVYLAASGVAYLAYAWDKSAARKDLRRTAEQTLLLIGLLGGWPGALVAQQQLRHKTQKESFRTAFWGTVGLNCAGLIWLTFHPV